MCELIAFLVLVSVLAFVHEAGHYITAKHFGVWVERFSIGIGKKIISVVRNNTEYCISLLPLGGYVKMHGEPYGNKNDTKAVCPEKSFKGKKPWQKALIVFAGPMANIVLSLFVFIGMYVAWGEPQMAPVIGEVYDGKPAQIAGLQPGDKILKIDEAAIESWNDLTLAFKKGKGARARVLILRDGDQLNLLLTPELTEVETGLGEKTKRYMIGIKSSMQIENKKLAVMDAVVKGTQNTILVTKNTVVTLGKMFVGAVSLKHLSGPVGIAQIAGSAAKNGTQSFLLATAVISIGLAILNLLPIPILDGGHLVLILVEAATGKPLSKKAMDVSLKIGLTAMVLIFFVAIYNDVTKIF